MVDYKLVLSDKRTGISYKIDVGGPAANGILGKRIGDEVEAGPIGLAGYKMKITGGSDRTGIPARKGLPGPGKKRTLLSRGVGFNPTKSGERQRKVIRGEEITNDFVQINAVVTNYGEKSLEELFPKEKPEEKKE